MPRNQQYILLAWLWIIGFTLFRLIYAGFFQLAPDEANYWQWSRYLDWGYHDQAPLLAWAIRLGTTFFGHTELAVRLPSIAALAVTSLYLVHTAARWIDARTAFNVALLTQGILLLHVGGLLATPDGLQAAAWAGATYHVARAYEQNTWRQWLLGGLWFGFGMLSKYTMVIFLPAAYAYGLFSSLHRGRLAGIKPYAGVLLGACMFLPVLFWNAAHNWNSVRHVAHIGGADKLFRLEWKYFGDYLASQAALLSPLVFILILMAWAAVILRQYPAEKWIYPWLAFTSLPMFAGFALLSLHTRVYGNWPAAAYLSAAVLVAALYGRDAHRVFAHKAPGVGRRLWPWALGSAYLLSAVVLLQTVWPVLPVPVHLDRTATELGGWRELGVRTHTVVQEMPQPSRTFIFGLTYQTASQLAFYVPGNPYTVSINRWNRPNVYDYWWQDEDLTGWDAVGVTSNPDDLQHLQIVFEHVQTPLQLDIFRPVVWRAADAARAATPVKTFYIYRAHGFKGGLRWLPPASRDIRVAPS